MQPTNDVEVHRQYIDEQMKKNSKLADDSNKAEQEVAIAMELAKLHERYGLSHAELKKLAGMKNLQIAHLEG